MDTSPFTSVFETHDAYVVRGTGRDPTFRWLTQFDVPDPSYVIATDDSTHLLVRGLETNRAKRDARVDIVEQLTSYEAPDSASGLSEDAHRLAEKLATLGATRLAVPPTFPVRIADTLRDLGHPLETATPIDDARVTKRPFERDALREAQARTEDAMRAVRTHLERTTITDGQLYADGTPVTADDIRRTIRTTLPPTTMDTSAIVAGGADGADPHERGSGPLPAHEPIVVDIFPRFESGYHGDMTRTFVRGTPSDEVQERHDAVCDALAAAKRTVTADTSAATVHETVADTLSDHGFNGRPEPDETTGFIHNTGHGVGLDIHERPNLSPNGETLREHAVVTLEPGLYDPSVGGVRVEDMVIVTDDGYESLNEMSYDMVL